MTLRSAFPGDPQGRRFTDVMNDPRLPFDQVLAFFDDPDRQRRMMESEMHHDRPPLAGVIRELENRADVHRFFLENGGRATMRFRQAVGVVVRIVMESHGWRKTGRKGSLGVRVEPASRREGPAAYRNTGGLSLWFTRAERYQPESGPMFAAVSKRSREIELRKPRPT